MIVKKYPLESGVPCKIHSCIKCCIKTKMPLTRDDIERIIGLGYKTDDFTVKRSGNWKLKNKHGRCVFLTADGCLIYPYRPIGCKLYPLVYDEYETKPILDNLCPYKHQFQFNKKHVEQLLKLVKMLEREAAT